MSKKELGKQIEALRKECGVSTYQLEKKGIHPSLPSTIEKGKKGYSMDSLIKYLNAIDEDIFLSVGKKNNHKNEIIVQLYEIRFNINSDPKKKWEYFFCIVGIDDSPQFRIASAKVLCYFKARYQEFLIDDFLKIYIKHISKELFIPK